MCDMLRVYSFLRSLTGDTENETSFGSKKLWTIPCTTATLCRSNSSNSSTVKALRLMRIALLHWKFILWMAFYFMNADTFVLQLDAKVWWKRRTRDFIPGMTTYAFLLSSLYKFEDSERAQVATEPYSWQLWWEETTAKGCFKLLGGVIVIDLTSAECIRLAKSISYFHFLSMRSRPYSLQRHGRSCVRSLCKTELNRFLRNLFLI